MAVKGKIYPIRNDIIITDMEFKEERTVAGLFIPSQDGKQEGIKPRWGKVFAIGPDQKDVKVGEWIYVEHGRWTRGITMQDDDGNDYVIRKVDTDAILAIADERPSDVFFPT
jgi:co-chaperonin GroES (HSP10)